MRYLYGDSNEFPLKINFLKLLEEFIDTSLKTITLENTVFELKEKVKDRRRLRNSVLDEMDKFIMTVENSIGDAVSKSDEQGTIIKYAEKSKNFFKRYIEDGKIKFSNEIFKEIEEFEERINVADEETRKLLELFFINDPILVLNKTYNIKALKDGYSVKVKLDYNENIKSVFELASSELPFWDDHVKTSHFVKGVEIPARMKKPFLKKDLVPDIVSLDDYYLSDLNFNGKEFEAVFRKKLNTTSERFRLKMNYPYESSIEVYHADENGVEKNIQSVPELKNELNTHRLNELIAKIIEQTELLYPMKHKLESLSLNDKDILEENLVFELLQNVAKIYSPVVNEIKKHSSSTEELSLKIEDENKNRSEIYLKKSQVRDKLSSIKEKGNKLADTLDI